MFHGPSRQGVMKTLATLLTTLAFATPAFADAVPEPIARLESLVGTWKGTGTIAMGGTTAAIAGTWSCKRTSGKFGVLCTVKITGIPGLPVYEETDLFGYEPGSGTYHWASVTNTGDTHDHVAKAGAADATKIQYVYTGTYETKPFKEVIDMELLTTKKKADTMTVRGETFVGGASASVMTVKLRK